LTGATIAAALAVDKPIRVLLVDDHRAVLWGLEKLIETVKPQMEVVGTASSTIEALELARRTRPDIVVLDVDPSEGRVIDTIPQLIERSGGRVLILSGLRNVPAHDSAVLAGARGIVLKREPPETIIRAIEKIHAGELWLDRATTGRIVSALSNGEQPADNPERKKIAQLTPRERQVINNLVSNAGANYKTIARKMQISGHTLRNHLSRIYAKLGVTNRMELYFYAQKHSLTANRD
jgi:DNA-binding NarL/FixJ family response regulator